MGNIKTDTIIGQKVKFIVDGACKSGNCNCHHLDGKIYKFGVDEIPYPPLHLFDNDNAPFPCTCYLRVIRAEELEPLPKIYAGLDRDGIAKLFVLDENLNPVTISHRDWLDMDFESRLGVEPGELLAVELRREKDNG